MTALIFIGTVIYVAVNLRKKKKELKQLQDEISLKESVDNITE